MGTTPDELRSEMEARRAHLARNVDLLADRVVPRRIARRCVDGTRKRLTDVMEHVMGTANDTTSSASATARAHARREGDGTGQPTERVSVTDGQTSGQGAKAMQQAPAHARRGTRGDPLAAGVIAFGAGMLAGALLPMSEPERRGGSQLREAAEGRLESVRSTAEEAVGTTTNSSRHAAQETADDLKQTGWDAFEGAGDQVGG